MKTINPQFIQDYARFRANGGGIVGQSALWAWKDAHTLQLWRERESDGQVRIVAEPEVENYFDSYGEPDGIKERAELEALLERYGCWWVAAEYFDGSNWICADSVGMCAGYADPTDPFQNCYVTQLMRTALDQLSNQWEAEQSGEH